MDDEKTPRQKIRAAIAAVGTRPLARELGHARPGTVNAWRSAGRVPPGHWRALNLALAVLGAPAIAEDVLRGAYEEETTE